MTTRVQDGQTLLFDADDTLWENNIYFERAIAAFISYLDHQTHTPEQVREQLNLCERATVAVHGYGLGSFRRSLVDCFEKLTNAPVTPEKHERIVSFSRSVAEQQIELLPGVAETLAELTARHRLLLVTKGDHQEQTGKLARSGLAPCFSAVEVVAEKHEAAYRTLVKKYELQEMRTWMIGNSPKSDINPALAAGLNAVFIPHDSTWILEHEALLPEPVGQKVLELTEFSSLLGHL